jgi:hypothetical protein
MSRGLGAAQRAILQALRDDEEYALTTPELAGRLRRSQRQIRRAVHALEARGLVIITSGFTRWRGAGEYGHKVKRRDFHGDVPATRTISRPGWHGTQLERDWVRAGMPTYGLWVWLPERHQQFARIVARHTRAPVRTPDEPTK